MKYQDPGTKYHKSKQQHVRCVVDNKYFRRNIICVPICARVIFLKYITY